MEVARHSRRNEECILIGHKGHPEVEGTMGQYDNPDSGIYLVEDEKDVAKLDVKNPEQLFYVTQTTLSVDDTQRLVAALQEKFPKIQGPKKDDICYATQNRQDAVKQLATDCDLILVVGAQNSSNSSRLQELSENEGTRSFLINNAGEIDPAWLKDIDRVGVTAGASAPEVLVQDVIKYLESQGGINPKESDGVEENIVFVLPSELRPS